MGGEPSNVGAEDRFVFKTCHLSLNELALIIPSPVSLISIITTLSSRLFFPFPAGGFVCGFVGALVGFVKVADEDDEVLLCIFCGEPESASSLETSRLVCGSSRERIHAEVKRSESSSSLNR